MQQDPKRCKQCNRKFTSFQKDFFFRIEQAFAHKQITPAFEQSIYQMIQTSQLPQDLGAPIIADLQRKRDLLIREELANMIEALFAQGVLTAQVEQTIMQRASHLAQDLSSPVIRRLQYLRDIFEIQRGNVPRVSTSIHLDSDEHAHFQWRATYYKPNKTIKEIAGRLIGTNKKCYFISDTGSDGTTFDWNNVSEVEENHVLSIPHKTKINGQVYTNYQHKTVLHLSMAKGSGGGGYDVPDRYYAKIVIDTIVRMWKRQLVIYKEMNTQGAIPEHVKTAVFQRDGGKCVQCGYEGIYIEYDHRIPRSKGGQNTLANIQLLCRMCNLKKGNRL